MSERWLSRAQRLDVVKRHLGSSIGRAEKVLKDACASGEVRPQYPLHLAPPHPDDGISFWLFDTSADGSITTYPPGSEPWEEKYDRYSEADLLDWLNCNYSAAAPEVIKSGAPGRPTSMQLVEAELNSRIAALKPGEKLGDSATDVADQLSAWLKKAHPTAASCKPKTIKNGLSRRMDPHLPPQGARKPRPKL